MTYPEPAANPSQVPAPPEGAGPTESVARPATIEPADLPIDPHRSAAQPVPQQPTAPLPPAAGQPTAPLPRHAAQSAAPLPQYAAQPATPLPPSATQPAMTAPTVQVPAVQPGTESASTAELGGAPQAYGSAPVPATYPGAAYPVSSVPVSAYPVSAYPTSGYPGGYPAAPAPRAKRPIATIVLSVTVGVLVLALGVLTTLFVIKSMDLNDTRAELTGQIAERDDKIKLNTSEIDGLKGQVQRTKDELAVVRRDLEGSENAAKDLTAAKTALTACLDKLTEFMASPTQARAKAANTACEAADKFM